MGLGGGGDCDNRGDELVRVGDPERSLIQPGPVGVDHGGGQVEDVARGGYTPRVLIGSTLRIRRQLAPNDSGVIRNNRTVGRLPNEQFLTTIFVRTRSRISLRISRLLCPLIIQSRRTTTTRRLPRGLLVLELLNSCFEWYRQRLLSRS